MNRVGIASESNATSNGIRRDASHARAPAPANPTRPDPERLPTRNVESRRLLSEYLSAPAAVQEAFDAQVARRLRIDLEVERWVALELADDPLATRLAIDRTVSVTWDERWTKRAKQNPKPGRIPYDRATDPLRLADLRDLWPHLTGEDVPRWGRVTCPHPDHEDRRPDCHVFADGWRCFGCNRRGDIIDLGGFLYGLTPRGSDFFRIRERLLADLGMEAAA